MNRHEQRLLVFNKYGGRCAYCGCKITLKNFQIDHIHPKYRGGENEMSNYNPSCRQCNYYKSTFTTQELRSQLHEIWGRINKSFIVRLALAYGIIKKGKFDDRFYFEKLKKKEKK